jgi:CRP/FNR family transcriptional regulator
VSLDGYQDNMEGLKSSVRCLHCTDKIGIFSSLTSEELVYINNNRHNVNFNAGEMIFKQQTALTHIVCLTSGMTKIYTEGLNKKNLILKIAKPVELIGGPGLFTDCRHHFSMSALVDCSACFIEVQAFKNVIEQNSDFALETLKHINLLSIAHIDRAINLTQKQMPGRMADALLYLSNKVYENKVFTTNLSRQDIADLSAMSKESAIRVLKEFKDTGLITVDGDTFYIVNQEGLVKISQTG